MIRYRLSSIPERGGRPYMKMTIIKTFEDGSCIVEMNRKRFNEHTIRAFRARGVKDIQLIKTEQEN